MIKLSSIGCNKLIKVESNLIPALIANPTSYSKLDITTSFNCCTPSTHTIVPTLVVPDCDVCEDSFRWSIDLTEAAENNFPVTGIFVKNIAGEVFNILTSPVEWDDYLTACPDGDCSIASTNPIYSDILNEALDTWLVSNAMFNGVITGICENTFMVCNLPASVVMSHIVYEDDVTVGGTSQAFLFNAEPGLSAYLVADGLYLTPQMFSTVPDVSVIEDGVYRVKIRATLLDGSYTEQETCFFLDCVTKCKVAFLMGEYLKERITRAQYDDAHMIYYSLVTDGNCACNCNELCSIYEYLLTLLDSNNTDCGC